MKKWMLAIMMAFVFVGVAAGCSDTETDNEETETEQTENEGNTEEGTEEEGQ